MGDAVRRVPSGSSAALPNRLTGGSDRENRFVQLVLDKLFRSGAGVRAARQRRHRCARQSSRLIHGLLMPLFLLPVRIFIAGE